MINAKIGRCDASLGDITPREDGKRYGVYTSSIGTGSAWEDLYSFPRALTDNVMEGAYSVLIRRTGAAPIYAKGVLWTYFDGTDDKIGEAVIVFDSVRVRLFEDVSTHAVTLQVQQAADVWSVRVSIAVELTRAEPVAGLS